MFSNLKPFHAPQKSIRVADFSRDRRSNRKTYFDAVVVQVHVVLVPLDEGHRLFDGARIVTCLVQIVSRFRHEKIRHDRMQDGQRAAQAGHRDERYDGSQRVRDHDAGQSEHLMSHLHATYAKQ